MTTRQNDFEEKAYNNLPDELYTGSFNALRPEWYFKDEGFTYGLNQFTCTEFIIDGVFSDRSENVFQDSKDKFENICNTILFKKKMSQEPYTYLIAFEHGAKLKSKIRSYKGFMMKNMPNFDIYEKEINVSNELSIFGIVIKLSSLREDVFNLFLDDSSCFILRTHFNYSMDDLVHKAFSCINADLNVILLNYLGLLNQFCFNKESADLFKIGGDHGEEYWSLQKFQRK